MKSNRTRHYCPRSRLAFVSAAVGAVFVTTSALGGGEVIPAWQIDAGFEIAAMATLVR